MRFFVLTLLSFLWLAACHFTPSPPSNAEIDADMREFESRFESDPRAVTSGEVTDAEWRRGGRRIAVHFEIPTEPSRQSLIIYLPGLGESARHGGALWRDTWVKAGFAVLTLQSERDANAFKSLSASDQGDLPTLGRDHFDNRSLKARIEDVLFVLETLQAKKHSAPFNRWDGNKVILAGYELGAQTAAALIGEKIGGVSGITEPARFQGAILISPFLDLAAGGMKSRFDAVNLPLLAITGTQDADPFGITSPSLRSAIFSQSPKGSKYLLELYQGTHRQLAGIDPAAVKEDESDTAEQTRGIAEPLQHPATQRDAKRQGLQNKLQPGSLAMEQARLDPRQIGQQLALVKAISVQFLNTLTQEDPGALHEFLLKAKSLAGRLADFRSR